MTGSGQRFEDDKPENGDLEARIESSSNVQLSESASAISPGWNPNSNASGPLKDRNPDALSTDSPPVSDSEDDEVVPLRRRLSRKLSSSSNADRSNSVPASRRGSASTTGRDSGRRRKSAVPRSQTGTGSGVFPPPNEADEEVPPGLKILNSGSRVKSSNALIEKHLDEIEEGEDEKAPHIMRGLLDTILRAAKQIYKPDFFRIDIKSLKIVFRTWLCAWIGVLLMSILPSQRWIGSSSYMLPLLGLVLGSGGMSITYGTISCLIEASFMAWGLLCAYVGLVIQWAVRGFPTKESVMAELVAEGVCAAGDFKCLQDEIVNGRFLRIDVSIITMFAIVVTIWIPGLFEQYNPTFFKLPLNILLLTTLPTVATHNATPYMNFWPSYRSSVIAAYFAFALKILACLLVFPVTSNEKYVDVIASVTKGTKAEADNFFGQALKQKPSSETFKETYSTIGRKCLALSSQFFKHDIDGLMLKLEVSYSRLDSGDIGEFRSRIREVLLGLNSIHFFLVNIQNRKEVLYDIVKTAVLKDEKVNVEEQEHHRHHIHKLGHFSKYAAQKYKPAGRFEYRSNKLWHEQENAALREFTIEELDEFYSLILSHYRAALESATSLLGEVALWLEEANKYRLWACAFPSSRSKREKAQESRKESLMASIKSLENCHAELVKSFPDYRSTIEGLTRKASGACLFILSQDALLNTTTSEYINRVHRLARYCCHLDDIQPKPRWLHPFKKTRAKSIGIELFGLGADTSEQLEVADFKPVHQVDSRDPDVSLPKTRLHQICLNLEKVGKWFLSPIVMFNTKRAFAALLPFTTVFVRQTIAFSLAYHEVWVTIIFVMTISRQAVDGAYGFVSRIYASFWGCILGMVIWYISSGSGHGNPYGLACACAGGFIIIAMHRHFNTNRTTLGTVMLSVTSVVVVGNSWETTYAPLAGARLGHGWRTCWIRFVTAVIGVSLGFIFTLFPSPCFGKQAIREVLSRNQHELGELLSSVTSFGLQRLDDPNVHVKRRSDPIRRKFKELSSSLLKVSQVASMMKYEPTFTGVWPSKRYKFLITMQREIISLQSMILVLLNKVDDPLELRKMMWEIGLTDLEQLSSTYAVFFMTANALLTKSALPSITPAGLSLRQWQHISSAMKEYAPNHSIFDLATSLYGTHDGRLRLAALAVAELAYDSIDATILVIKGLVGEAYDTDDKIFQLNSFDLSL